LEVWNECKLLIMRNDYTQLQNKIGIYPDLSLVLDIEGWSLLTLAVCHGSMDCVKMLVCAGSDLNQRSHYGLTVLMYAVNNRYEKIVRYLMDQGAVISLRTKKNKESAFDFAIKNIKKQPGIWFELFAKYKDQFDAKDMNRYHELRILMLFCESIDPEDKSKF
jgi:hypothetical protein